MGTGGVSYTDALTSGLEESEIDRLDIIPRGGCAFGTCRFHDRRSFLVRLRAFRLLSMRKICSTTPREIMSNDVVGTSYLS
jgi:hypothetical protein